MFLMFTITTLFYVLSPSWEASSFLAFGVYEDEALTGLYHFILSSPTWLYPLNAQFSSVKHHVYLWNTTAPVGWESEIPSSRSLQLKRVVKKQTCEPVK